MKKALLIIASVLCFAAVASAQPRAIGLRAGYGGELSYQHSIGGNSFAEIDLGAWGNSGNNFSFFVTGAYDFIVAGNGACNVYVGPAASLGSWKSDSYSGFAGGIGGQLGVEYNFSFPLQLSLDYRPIYYFGSKAFYAYGIALGIRYRF